MLNYLTPIYYPKKNPVAIKPILEETFSVYFFIFHLNVERKKIIFFYPSIPMNLRTGFDGTAGDDGPWKPPADTIDKVQGFLITGEFPFDYSLPRYVCQMCKRRGNQHDMICCDGCLDTQNRPCCGVSFHKLCADPMRQEAWPLQNPDSDNFLCDHCYDELEESDSTEEHDSACECGACESEYVDSDGNLADFVVPDEDPSCHTTDCDCDFCQDMHDASEQWAQMRMQDADSVARSVGDAIDRLQERFGKP